MSSKPTKNSSSSSGDFDRAMRSLMRVPKSELDAQLAKERSHKIGKKKRN